MDRLHTLNAAYIRPHQKPLLTALAVLLGLTPMVSYALSCYREWMSLGGGGLPHSLRGWLMNAAMHLRARRDHRADPAPYKDDDGVYGAAGAESFFTATKSKDGDDKWTLPPRQGPRPDVPTCVAPQRQTTQQATPSTVAAQTAFLAALGADNPSLFATAPSALESPAYPALWLAENQPVAEWFMRGKGEWAHVHPEGSTHVVLSLVDAARVVRAGWGERHKLSGVSGWLPWGYVLVYAPGGNVGGPEWAAWREIVVAGARFVARAAGAEGEVVVQA